MAENILPCQIEDCNNPVKCRGFCNAHYLRLIRYGDPHRRRGITHGDTERWIKKHLNYDADHCLTWPYARLSNGYPSVRYKGKHWVASRLMCVKVYGEPLNPNMDCCHSCNNGHLGCMNPNHLYWGTRKQNIRDAKDAGTWTQHGRKGCRENGAKKLSTPQVLDIRTLAESGQRTIADIGRQFGVARCTVRDIRDGKTWAWLK